MATTSPTSARTATPATATEERDWAATLTDKIVDQIDAIRDKTTGPAIKVVQYILFGAFAISLGTVAVIIAIVGSVRFLDNYLPDSVFGETHTWVAHLLMGVVFLAGGVAVRIKKVRPATKK